MFGWGGGGGCGREKGGGESRVLSFEGHKYGIKLMYSIQPKRK